MNPKTSHKIIAVGAMAAIAVIGIVMMRSHPASPVAESVAPPPPVAQTSDAAADAPVPTMVAPAAVAPVPEAPVAVNGNDSVGPRSAVTTTTPAHEPKPTRSRPAGNAGSIAVLSKGSMSTGGSTARMSGDSAPETVAQRAERLSSLDVSPARPSPSTVPAEDLTIGTSAVLAASDSQITMDVQTALAGEVAVKEFEIGVSTTDGVVSLSGHVATQGAIDQVKDVAGKVKDVKRVDTSALILASL